MNEPDFDLSDPEAVSFCPACGAGFRAGSVRCSDCGEELVSRAAVESRVLSSPVNPYRPPGVSLDPVSSGLPLELLVDGSVDGDAVPHFDFSDPDAAAFCPSCGAGYRTGYDRCVDCGEELIPRSLAEERAFPAVRTGERGSWVPLGEVANPFKADLLAASLKEADIPFLTLGGAGLRFVVSSSNHKAATQILQDLDELERSEEGPEDEPTDENAA